ncbi:MAG TPA: hypothetical protein VK678_24195, partial [Bradyrhizobium sp.]|nr:hypothetical protein [Bradyrhizobium sp.]
ESVHSRHEQVDHHNVKLRRLESVHAGMGARRKRGVVLVPGQDGLNCGTDAGVIIDDENSRHSFSEMGHSLSVAQV